ncbi:interleukin-1 receptor accessory protein isoform X2 [Oreochromis niloticus]|uniref:interleukin-1 receptor accessory protein isoform X2 n=1 Tax=Oreochromis niloticus TaxID=8128 RepID=UPI000905C7F1|nr:interleukin-1 receptor accessory protein isoform X2 [Oreochromis niloticus]
MNGKISLLLLSLIFLTSTPGVCPLSFQEVHVKAGEMAVLHCPSYRGYSDGDAEVFWTSHTVDEMKLFNMSTSAEQRQMGVLVHGRILVILRASVNHQGNYSCSFRNSSRRSWISLKVYTAQSRESEQMNQLSRECYTEESCRLYCPEKNIPFNTLNITTSGITWHKEGGSSPKDGYFPSVKKEDSGIYTCTRSYLYDGQIYNMTSTVKLDVQPNKITEKAVIISPENKQVFEVDLGSTVVIDCKAVMMSDFDDLFWLSGSSFVDKDTSLPVFYNDTRVDSREEISMTTSLIFRKVSEDDLSKNYTCKLQSAYQTSFVTITLKQKDGKSYNACLMYYKSSTDQGLSEDDRKRLESEMKNRFGYSLCLYSPDVVPDRGEAVLHCIKQSQTVVLVPCSEDSGSGVDLLNSIQASLKKLQTHVVLIKTQTAGVLSRSSSSEALKLWKAADCVTWKGKSSMLPSSAFWKQLRYYLPPPQRAPRALI